MKYTRQTSSVVAITRTAAGLFSAACLASLTHAAETTVTNESLMLSGATATTINYHDITGGFTVGAGDTLNLGGIVAETGSPANNVPVWLQKGNLLIQGGTLNLQLAQKNTAGSQGSAAYVIESAFTMDSGTVNFGAASTIDSRGHGTTTSTRLQVNGNAFLNGGTFAIASSGAELWLKGGGNVIGQGFSMASNIGIVMNSGTQSLKSDVSLNSVLLRLGGAQTVTLGADTNSSLTVNTLKFHQQSANSSTTLKLGSDLVLNDYFSLAVQASNYTINIDTNGHTLDMTAAKRRFEFVTSNATTLNFAGSGEVIAHSYKFDHNANVTVNIGTGTTLVATRGGATNTLSASDRGSVDASSIFIFDYKASEDDGGRNDGLLYSTQAIGKVIVRNGVLKASSNLNMQGGLVVESGAVFDLTGKTITTGTFTFGINGANSGSITDSTSGGAVSIAGKALAFDFAAPPASDASYSFFTTGITGSAGSVSVTFSGLNALALTNNNGVWSAILDGLTYTFTESSGILSVASAIPEPSTVALIAGVGAAFFVLIRQRKS